MFCSSAVFQKNLIPKSENLRHDQKKKKSKKRKRREGRAEKTEKEKKIEIKK